MSEEGKSSTAGCNIEQRKLRSAAQTQLNMCTKGVASSKDTTASTATEPDQPDMAQIHGMLSKILEETADLKEIRRSMSSVDTKLSTLISRITQVEDRVSQLEDEQANLKARPAAATKEDIKLLTDRLATAEDRSRRNNLRFVGIPEGAEKNNVTAFLNEFISATLGIDPTPGGIEMDRAHRIGTRLEAGEKNRGRTIVARLLRYKDCQAILEAAREKKRLTWNGKQVMIFPDYSRETQRKREAFSRCKKALHERKIKFGMLYPALLKIFINGQSPRVFDDPEKAMEYIERR